jgi:hypothetical protein
LREVIAANASAALPAPEWTGTPFIPDHRSMAVVVRPAITEIEELTFGVDSV